MARYLILIVLLLFVGAAAFGWLRFSSNVEPSEHVVSVPAPTGTDSTQNDDVQPGNTMEPVTVLAENLTIPWDLVFLPDGDMLVSERPGTLLRIDPQDGEVDSIPIEGVAHRGEGGLLGVELHPDFSENSYVYLYRTTTESGAITNEVLRYRFVGGALEDATRIISGIPGAPYHDGGRMAFGPDGHLYIATGDAGTPSLAQDTSSLAGKILRVAADGSIPENNPFGNAVYSYGHRNPQGLTWDMDGDLYATEHGRSGVRSGYDELNLIEMGGNYGWPESQGDTVMEGTIAPLIHSGPSTTWAPASAQFFEGSVYFGGLRGATLYEAVLDGTQVIELQEHFSDEFGRIRSVVLGPDGALYLTTSNRDGRGDPVLSDDRIIRIDPAQL